MLRSPFSGLPQELGAAYVTLAAREGRLADLLAHERIAAGPSRDALLAFTATLADLRAIDPAASDSVRCDLAQERFGWAQARAEQEAAPGESVFALLEASLPEPAAGVATHNPRFSASQLNTYVECPRKWYYRYVCAAVEDKGSSASFYGTAFHAALEDFHGAYPEPGIVEESELQRKALGYINAAFERHKAFFDTAVEYELQLRRARRTGARYVQWLVAQG